MDLIDVISVIPAGTIRGGKFVKIGGNARAIDANTVEIEPNEPIQTVILNFKEDTSGVEYQVTQLDGSQTEFREWEDNREGVEVAGFVPADTNAVMNNPTGTLGVQWIVKRTASGEQVTEEKYGEYEWAEYQSYAVSSSDGTTWSGLIRYKRQNANTWLIETTREGTGVAPRTVSKVANDSLDKGLDRDYQRLKTDLDNRASDLDRKLAEEQRKEEAKERVELAEGIAEELGTSVTLDDVGDLVPVEEYQIAQNFQEILDGLPSPFSRFQTDAPIDNNTYTVQSPLVRASSVAAGLIAGGNYIRLTVAPQCIVVMDLSVDGFPQDGFDLNEDYGLNMYAGDTLEIEWKGSDTKPILKVTIGGIERLNYRADVPNRGELAGARISLVEARYQGTIPPSQGSGPSGSPDYTPPPEDTDTETTQRGSTIFLALLGMAGLALAYFVLVMKKQKGDEE